MSVTALQGIRLNVTNIDLAEQFYRSLGMVEDLGLRRIATDDSLASVITDNDPSGLPGTRSIALRWPCDPHMHLILAQQDASGPTTGWPKQANQLGATVLGLLVSDVALELDRVRRYGGAVVSDRAVTQRLLGETESAFVRDPDGNLVELIEVNPSRAWDLSRCTPHGAEITFLHVQLNTTDLDRISGFYEGLGFTHNYLNDFRPGAQYVSSGQNPFQDLWGQKLDGNVNGMKFLRLQDDPSQMHLEILELEHESLRIPGAQPTWLQQGFIRMCFKAQNMDRRLAELARRGVRVLPENERAALGWGDAEWSYFPDPDANILTLEEWFPTGHWGERH